MKIAITADLHLGISSYDILTNHAKSIKQNNPDVLIIAGDIGEVICDFSMFRNCIKLYKKILNKPIAFIAGNHDLYSNPAPSLDPKVTSLNLWEKAIPNCANQENVHYLENENLVIGNVAIVGSYLHYDLSAKDTIGQMSQMPDLWYQSNKHNIVSDGNYHIDLPDDKTFSAQIREKFITRLKLAEQNITINKIIVVTHVPCLEVLITRKPHDHNWSRGTPFFGNLSSEADILNCTKVTHVVSAHTHIAIDTIIKKYNRKIRCINIGGDYSRPATVILEL